MGVAARATPPGDITPVDFFTRWVPESVRRDEERRARLAGTSARIVFHLEGLDGGEFTVSIDDSGAVTGAVGAVAEPDLRVRVDVATWRQLNAGVLAAPEAVLRRRVRLEGDWLLALELHWILG